MKLKVLFLCTGNSCLSQMAEAWANRLCGDRLEAWSAGTHPRAIDPFAIRAMQEHGIDISAGRPKHVKEILGFPFDYVVTVCDAASQECPIFPGRARIVHRGFDDPPDSPRQREPMRNEWPRIGACAWKYATMSSHCRVHSVTTFADLPSPDSMLDPRGLTSNMCGQMKIHIHSIRNVEHYF